MRKTATEIQMEREYELAKIDQKRKLVEHIQRMALEGAMDQKHAIRLLEQYSESIGEDSIWENQYLPNEDIPELRQMLEELL